MSRKIQMDVTVKPEDTDKRQKLTTMIDMALVSGGMRITKGTYRVTVEHLTPRELAAEEKASLGGTLSEDL